MSLFVAFITPVIRGHLSGLTLSTEFLVTEELSLRLEGFTREKSRHLPIIPSQMKAGRKRLFLENQEESKQKKLTPWDHNLLYSVAS